MSTSRAITNKEKRMLTQLLETKFSDSKELSIIANKLKQIALLCRLFNKKVEITYESPENGQLSIVARVWFTTCKKVILKNGNAIPTNSISQVKIL